MSCITAETVEGFTIDRRLSLHHPASMFPVTAFFPTFSPFHIVILLREDVFVTTAYPHVLKYVRMHLLLIIK